MGAGTSGDQSHWCACRHRDYFLEFPAYMSGPWGAAGFVIPLQDCLDVFDFDADADVDLKDFASFQQAFTGEVR